jgi:small neutral amino acid transporter SnatA (MarC family)
LIALVVLVGCLLVGRPLLSWLSLEPRAISIAGGIVLFLIALRMIFPSEGAALTDGYDGEPFIVPLAIPLVAGPSGMAAVMLMGSNEPTRLGEWSLALILAWIGTSALLFSGTLLYKLLGMRVLIAVERLMGMLLVAISVQMFLDGLGVYLKLPVAG